MPERTVDPRLLLMAGGSGTRLWPLSTEARPKQFLPLLSQKSLLAETFARLLPLSRDVWVATSDRHVALVREELPELPPERILGEPVRRNSGPAILAAALRFAADGDPLTAAIPSDQTARDGEALRRAIAAAAGAADRASVVVLAVPPTRPDTDYGYLEIGSAGAPDFPVERFVEKPDIAAARRYVASGRHLWNAGIFVFRPSRLIAEARRVAGDLLRAVQRYVRSGADADYAAIAEISIDFGVMEKASGVRAVRLEAGWSDVGTWRSVRELRGPSDALGNLVVSDRPVLAPGIRDTAIVSGPDGLLVMPFEREGELRAAVEERKRREEPVPAGSYGGKRPA